MSPLYTVLLCVLVLRTCRFCVADDNDSSLASLMVNKDTTGLYYVNASVGTPAQIQMLRVDVAQPYTWLLSQELKEARSGQEDMDTEDSTFYNADNSSTAHRLFDQHVHSYQQVDRISYNASVCMDTMELLSLANMPDSSPEISANRSVGWRRNSSSLWFRDYAFFDATQVSFDLLQGALGLGGKINLPGSTVDSTQYNESFYFLDQMLNNNLVSAASYSLWLGADTLDPLGPADGLDNCGKIILGGVDRSLYTGDFVKFDTVPFIEGPSAASSRGYPIIPLNKVSVRSGSGQVLNLTSDHFLEPVLLDSRYRYNYLPLSLIVQIAMQSNAYYVESLDRWLLACDVASKDAAILFQFGNLIINVPLRDLMGPTYDLATNGSLHFSNSQPACELRVLPKANIGMSILGGPFLKNVYMAAELDSHQIALAQASTLPRTTISTTTERISTSSHAHAASGTQSANNGDESPLQHKVPLTQDNPSAIKSGIIPFATTNNYSSYDTLILQSSSAQHATVNGLINQFTATISSDGVVFTGRSFYNTSYTTGPSLSTSSGLKHRNNAAKNNFLNVKNSTPIKTYTTLIPLLIIAIFALLA
ncbi:LAFA_0G17766g1_1 [Lachancea sp. 'fantastica']|nr:LAFA_0G17766g1_1 [Lachancea sp. 'fantastica']